MNKFVKINNAYVNMDLVQRVYLEAVPKRHYADEPNYGSIVFKPGETIHIRDEESLKRVKTALGLEGAYMNLEGDLIRRFGENDD